MRLKINYVQVESDCLLGGSDCMRDARDVGHLR